MADYKSAYFYLALTILLWSATPAVAKLGLEEINNIQLLFYCNVVGIISLSIAVLALGKARFLSQYKISDYARMFGMGFLGLYLYYIFLYGGFALAPAGQANMINYLWPLFVVIFSILILKEKFTWKTLLAIAMGFAGALIVFSHGDFSSFQNEYTPGYLLAFAGAMCYGLFSVLGKKLRYEAFTSMLVFYLASLLLVTPTMLLLYGFVFPHSLTTWLAIFFLGGLSNSIGFVFWFKALEKGKTASLANLIYINPFLSLVYVFFLNGESIPAISILGLALIVGGALVQLKSAEK
ncbi:MAG: DMT family transporter [Candidatus Micrarchaeia archaeon]